MQTANDQIVATAAKTATYGGGSAAVFFGLSANEIAALIGAAVAIVGLGVQWYYRHQEFQMRKRAYEWDGETERRKNRRAIEKDVFND